MRAVFLDRDGVINEIVYHAEMGIVDSPFALNQFKLLPHAVEGIRILKRAGFKIFVVSNQPGIAKKHFTMETFERINERFRNLLKRNKVQLDGVYYCLHHPDAKVRSLRRVCDCRKPKSGLLIHAAREWGIDLGASYMVGDGVTDIQAGKAVGCKTIFIGNWKCDICRVMENNQTRPDGVARDLRQAALLIREWEAERKFRLFPIARGKRN